MSRPAAVTAEQIRSTVLAMLAEAGDAAPATGTRFRQIVSVRKLRARLGAGDPATLARALNAIEAEVVRAGLAEIAIPDLPPDIADLMRTLWQTAVAVQLDDVVRLRQVADTSVAAAEAARTDAELRVELLRQEVHELRTALTARDVELADLRAQHGVLRDRCATLDAQANERQAALDALTAEQADRDRAHTSALEAAQHRYEALSKQLLQETAHQREALKKEHSQAASQLKFAERRIAALEGERDRLDSELAREREARQHAVGEALALKAVNAQQHAQLADFLRDLAQKPTPAAHTGLATAKRPTGSAPAKRKGK
ncbi:MAG: DNA-binding protein [Paraburkholderia sp.]|uniref:DNA-binding protein n=1 Tax=Paraburkholderia sp. TaxID=1926495 RepID=UPI00120C16F1|nr:DNA-binding protein [Paraburkholderia sp.]TAM04961.1 MAG: DNA-binding protein [Paraburkholderia sp.]